VWAAVAYEGPARDVVHALKFGRRAVLADTLAAQIVARAPAGLLHGTLVPVPLGSSRARGRGFNQAQLVAGAVARRSGLPLSECLVRRGAAAPQAVLGRPRRVAAIAGTIAVRAGMAVPRAALLVDDVVTTGATLAACATALRAAGAEQVTAVTWARTPAR
jgi:ComF family protein